MSFVLVSPSQLMAAAADVAGIGSAISAANAAALAPTSVLAAAGADEVSAAVAALFSAHAGQYQQLGARAALFHEQFVQALTGAASAYASAEATNVEQQVLGLINAPTQALLGRPLIGNGADGTAANPNGGAGGLLYGNGGNGFSQTTAGLTGGTGGSAGLIGKPETLSHNDVRLLRTQTHPRKCQKSPKMGDFASARAGQVCTSVIW